MKLKDSYGRPPVFVPALFVRALLGVLTLTIIGFALLALLHEPLVTRDILGTLVCAPIVAYIIHLWLAPSE